MSQAAFDPRPPVVSTEALRREARSWLSPALLGTMMISMSVHAVPVIQALRDLTEVRSFVGQARSSVHDFLWTTYEVIAPPPPPTPVEEKVKEPEPEAPPPPKAVAQPVTKAEPVKEAKPVDPPPAAAQAGKTLTAPADDKLDLSNDFTMIQGDGKYAGGTTAAKGTSTDAVRDPNARGDGVPGGKGSASAPVAPPPASTEPDRSKVARAANAGWNCPFPPEADSEGVDSAVVSIMVTVRGDGSVQSVKVVSDPGTGFGRAARQCALGQRFEAALDRTGQAIVGTTAPFNVRFTR